MAKLTTHVLDTAHGRPATGVRIELYRAGGAGDGSPIVEVETNRDGRTPTSLMEGALLTAGVYRLLFHIGDYYSAAGHADARRFLDIVPIVFVVDDPSANYHVPLLVSPWSYSTYRGS